MREVIIVCICVAVSMIVGYIIRRILEKKGYNMDSIYFWRREK